MKEFSNLFMDSFDLFFPSFRHSIGGSDDNDDDEDDDGGVCLAIAFF